MKIDDVSLTIFAWDGIPSTRYHLGSLASSTSNLGLLRIHTDEGLEGHAFLGAATNPASMDGPQLIRTLKPMLMGQTRWSASASMAPCGWSPYRKLSHHRCRGHRTMGPVGKIARLPVHALMGTCRTSIMAYASSQVLPDIAAYVDQAQTSRRMAGRVQDPSTARTRQTSRCARPCARPLAMTPADARFDMELQLH